MDQSIKSVSILGVRVDQVDMEQSVKQVDHWLKGQGKHYIVTTNVEFVMKAQQDLYFKEILNNADLSVADSLRLGWANFELNQKSLLKKIIFWPFFLSPSLLPYQDFQPVGGVYLLEKLCQEAANQEWSVGFLGGKGGVAQEAALKLQQKYPELKVIFTSDGPRVNNDGEQTDGEDLRFMIYDLRVHKSYFVNRKSFPTVDALFVGFGQVKQEKWIAKNLPNLPVKVAMGVGGSFDEISGEVPAAPLWLWQVGFKWLFRLILQPGRVKRFGALVQFVFRVFKA